MLNRELFSLAGLQGTYEGVADSKEDLSYSNAASKYHIKVLDFTLEMRNLR